jgi:hypothetical protein
MNESPVDASGDVDNRVEPRKEAWVMALYVAVCLLAALTAVAEKASDGHLRAFGIIWGTTIGLALAHVFAFRVSARIVAQGRIRRDDANAVIAQLAGALGAPCSPRFRSSSGRRQPSSTPCAGLLALFIALVGFQVARTNGAGTARSVVYGGVLFVTALAVALLKNVLSGH